MRTAAVHCDRCGESCIERSSIVKIEADAVELRKRLPGTLDLCGSCSERLLEWLRAGRTPAAAR